ncbi:hypothetical protein ACOSP7_009279 [Xanthoceras sorbifolium]
MKMSNSGSEQRDHGTARCARDEGGGNAPIFMLTCIVIDMHVYTEICKRFVKFCFSGGVTNTALDLW